MKPLLVLSLVGCAFGQANQGWADLGSVTQIRGATQNLCPADHFGYSTSVGYIGAGTSTTSLTVSSSGTVTLTTQSGLSFITKAIANQALLGTTGYIRVYETSNPSNFIQGQSASYTGTSLQFTASSSGGSGTHTDWTITPGLPFSAVIQPSTGPVAIFQSDYSFNGLCGNVITNSNGGTVDTKRNQMFIWGGGHGGSGGNEVYILDMNATPPVMKRVNNPSIFDSPLTCTEVVVASDLAIDATDNTKVTSASHSFTSASNYCQIHITTNGTGLSTGFYQILATSGGAAYLNRSAGTAGATGGSYVEVTQEQYPSDNGPVMRHTYNQTQYLSAQDLIWTWNGPSYGGPIMVDTWTWNPATLTWTNETMQPAYNGGAVGCSSCTNAPYNITDLAQSSGGNTCAYDPIQQRVLCINGNILNILQWTQSNHTWQQVKIANFCQGLTACGNVTYTSALDPLTQVWLLVGTDGVSSPSTAWNLRVWAIDISQGANLAVSDWTSSMSACTGTNNYYVNGTTTAAGMNVQYPGLAYDSASDLIVGYPWDGNNIYLFNTWLKTCVPETIYSSPSIPASGYNSPTTEGIFGRFQYMPGIGKFVLYNAVVNDAFSLVRNASASNGLGSTATPSSAATTPIQCLDVDGDGYGVGPGCLGPDADDFDATVHTWPQIKTKYSSLATFLNHLGYTPANIWYLAPAPSATAACLANLASGETSAYCGPGTDSASCKNNPALPCATYAYVIANFAAGDMIVVRDGVSTSPITFTGGSAGSPTYLMSFPGERPTIAVGGISTSAISTINFGLGSGYNWLVIDGIKATGSSGGSSGTIGTGANGSNIILRHIEVTDGADAGLKAINGVVTHLTEYNVSHDYDGTLSGGTCGGGCQHALYYGARGIPDNKVVIQRNLMWTNNAGYPLIQVNGRVTNAQIRQNLLYNSNNANCIALLEGVSNSIIDGNQCFNSGGGIQIADYDGSCTYSGSGGNPNPTANEICPWDQTGNTISNNTVAVIKDQLGAFAGHFGMSISNSSSGCDTTSGSYGTCFVSGTKHGNLGGNTFINNIIYADGSGYPFMDQNCTLATFPGSPYGSGDCSVADTTDTTLANTTFQYNILWPWNGGGTNVVFTAPKTSSYTGHTIPALNAGLWAAASTGNINSDPQFTAINATYYTNPALYNLTLQPTSPGVHAGIQAIGTPFDLRGSMFTIPTPSLGSLEVVSSNSPGSSSSIIGAGIIGAGVIH